METITTALDGPVGTITVNRPEVRNAISAQITPDDLRPADPAALTPRW